MVDFECAAELYRERALFKSTREVALDTHELLLSNFIAAGSDLDEMLIGTRIDTDNRPIIEFAAPRLAVQSARQGMLNLLYFRDQMRGTPRVLWAPPDFAQKLERAIASKRVIIEGLRFAMENNVGGQLNAYRQALAQDPENGDLIHAVGQLSR